MPYKIEDHANLDAALSSLQASGFQKSSLVAEHYRHPQRLENGYFQRADVFVLPNLGKPFARVSFWEATV